MENMLEAYADIEESLNTNIYFYRNIENIFVSYEIKILSNFLKRDRIKMLYYSKFKKYGVLINGKRIRTSNNIIRGDL